MAKKRSKATHAFTVRLTDEQSEALQRIAALRGALPASVSREFIVEGIARHDAKFRQWLEETYGVQLSSAETDPRHEPRSPGSKSGGGYMLNDRL